MGSRPKRVVVIAYFFPPIATIGYQRPLRLCRYLREQGVETTVFAGHARFMPLPESPDTALNGLIPEGVKVRRIPSLHPVQWALNLRDALLPKPKTAPSATGSGDGAKPGDSDAKSTVIAWVDALIKLFSFPDRYSGWIVTVLPFLVAETLRRRPDAIFVTGPPWSPLVLAYLVGRITGIPICLDYRDPWTLNPYHSGKPGLLRVWLEKKLLNSARGIITNTAGMAECYAKAFPRIAPRIHPVYNGIDSATVREMERLRAETPPRSDNHFRICHIGTLYRNRMPESLAGLLAKVAADWRGERDVRFRFLGWLEDSGPISRAFEAQGCLHKLELPGQVGSAAAKREQVETDVLLLLQSGTALQIPAKIFEYALTGRPIVCFTDALSETGRLIESYDLGKVYRGDEAPERVRTQLESLANDPGGSRRLQDFLRDFDGTTQSRKMADILLG